MSQDDTEAGQPRRSAADAVRAVAEVLRGADDVVVIWGERVSHGERGRQAVEALIALVGALGLAGEEESGLIEIPAGTNGRGLREAGCLPGLGPGLKDAPAAGKPASEIMRGVGEDVDALLLVHVDPERELAERSHWQDALGAASAVIAFAGFRSEALEEHADVVFPAESYAEKEGTVTHPDGRIQRVRQALGHPGEVRAEWSVLAELCARLDAPVEALTAPMVTAQVMGSVPFYGELGLDEIGGRGVRWQERGAASALPVEQPSEEPLEEPPAPPSGDGMRLGAVASLWSSREIDHSPSLRFLAGHALAELSPADAGRLEVRSGDEVELAVNGDRVSATVAVRSGISPGAVFLAPALLPPGNVEVSKP